MLISYAERVFPFVVRAPLQKTGAVFRPRQIIFRYTVPRERDHINLQIASLKAAGSSSGSPAMSSAC